MKANTRLFGEIDIEEDKIIRMEQGIVGFPDLKNFALIYDLDKGTDSPIMWLQSMDEVVFALPVMRATEIVPDYAPMVNDELISWMGELNSENLLLLVTVTTTGRIEDISINLKAPILINSDTNKGGQFIVENDYEVKYRIYDLLQAKKKAGE